MTILAELVEALQSWGIDPAELREPSAPLISSGLLDSLALFNLSVWVEEKLGSPIDPTTFDVTQAWDSVESILRFVEARGAPVSQSRPAGDSAPAAPVASQAVASQAVASHRDERYRIVRYEPRWRGAVTALLRGLWSPDAALNEAVFGWKYEDNPFAADPLVYLALRDGAPVAMRAFCGSAWEIGGACTPQAVYLADDFVVAEKDRNHGLFNRFTEAATLDLRARNQSFFLSLSALRVTRLQSLASGSNSIGVVPVIAAQPKWIALADRVGAAVSRAPLLWRHAHRLHCGAPAATSFARLDATLSERIGDLDIAVVDAAKSEDMAALIARLPYDGRIRHLRDARFFDWRYRHPLHAYRFVLARRGKELAGYAVLQRGLSPYSNQRRVNVADWACESEDVLSVLLSAARRWGRFAELVAWRMPAQQRHGDAFERSGFIEADTDHAARGLPCVLLRRVHDEATAAAQPERDDPWQQFANWDLRMAYTSYA